jgi:Uma2 family endonuclease
MSVVTIAEAWPAAGRPFTVAELDRMPDDGRRYELLDGVLIVSPRPTTIHQFVAMRLLRVLADACPGDLCVVPEPAVELGSQTEFDPDLVVVHMDQIGGAKFTEPPLLVVEIRSPSTALVDLNRKKAAYERFGVPTYWIVNPDPSEPELTVFELRDGHYAPAAKASGPFVVDRPFHVSIDPAGLTHGLRRLPTTRTPDGQLLRPTPAHMTVGLAASRSEAGRHCGPGTTPGSTSSRPSKNRSIPARFRNVTFSATISFIRSAISAIAPASMSLAGWEIAR